MKNCELEGLDHQGVRYRCAGSVMGRDRVHVNCNDVSGNEGQ